MKGLLPILGALAVILTILFTVGKECYYWGYDDGRSTAYNSSYTYAEDDEELIRGEERAYKDVFLNLWNASDFNAILKDGDIYEADCFSLVLNKKTVDGDQYIDFCLASEEIRLTDALEEDRILFYTFSYNAGAWQEIFSGDSFYMYASLGEYSDDRVVATTRITSDCEKVAIIIMHDNLVHKIAYDNN